MQGIMMLEIIGVTDLPKIKNSAYPLLGLPYPYPLHATG
jgi:hypothetical protein